MNYRIYRVTIVSNSKEHYLVMSKTISEAMDYIEEKYPDTKGKPYSAKAISYGDAIKINGEIECEASPSKAEIEADKRYWDLQKDLYGK